MSGLIKIALSFSTGAIVGGGIGALIAARRLKKHYEEKVQNDIREIREYYEYRTAVNDNGYSAKKPDKESLNQEKVAREKVDYTQFSRKPENTQDIIRRAEEQLAEEEAPMEEYVPRKKSKTGPKLIREDQFGNNPALDRVVLHYYTEDDILTTDEDEEYSPESRSLLVGNWIERIGFGSAGDTDDAMYIRNEDMRCDYKIEKITAPYTYAD